MQNNKHVHYSLSFLNFLVSKLTLRRIDITSSGDLYGLNHLFVLHGTMELSDEELSGMARSVSRHGVKNPNPVYELRSKVQLETILDLTNCHADALIAESKSFTAPYHEFSVFFQRTASPVGLTADGTVGITDSAEAMVTVVPHSTYLSVIMAAMARGQVQFTPGRDACDALISTMPIQQLMRTFIADYGFIEGETIAVQHDRLVITGGGETIYPKAETSSLKTVVARAPEALTAEEHKLVPTMDADTKYPDTPPTTEEKPTKVVTGMSFSEALAAQKALDDSTVRLVEGETSETAETAAATTMVEDIEDPSGQVAVAAQDDDSEDPSDEELAAAAEASAPDDAEPADQAPEDQA